MIGIVIVAHGGLADEYLKAMEHVVGKQPGTAAVSIGPDDCRDNKQTEVDRVIDSVDTGHGVVVVTDMFGGTPSNLALNACESSDRKVLYGANLPLLVKLAKLRNKPLHVAVERAVMAARQYINCADSFQKCREFATG